MFGTDPKAEAKKLRENFVVEATDHDLIVSQTATIRERVRCDHARKGMHYISATLKDGHIKSFSCECRDTVDELDLNIELDSRGGEGNSCYDTYLLLKKFITMYEPERYGVAKIQGRGLIPILAPIIENIRDDSYRELHRARATYSTMIWGNSARAGDLSLPRIYRTGYMMKKLIHNYFHPTISKMFDVTYTPGVDEGLVGAVSFKREIVFLFDEYLRPTHSRTYMDSLGLSAQDFCFSRVTQAAQKSTDLSNNSQCAFCADGKTYSRMRGHLSRKPHKMKEIEVLQTFFYHFIIRRQRNLQRFMRDGLHKHPQKETEGFRRLVYAELILENKHALSASER